MKWLNFVVLLFVVLVYCIFGGVVDVEDQVVQEFSGDELYDSFVFWGFENFFVRCEIGV